MSRDRKPTTTEQAEQEQPTEVAPEVEPTEQPQDDEREQDGAEPQEQPTEQAEPAKRDGAAIMAAFRTAWDDALAIAAEPEQAGAVPAQHADALRAAYRVLTASERPKVLAACQDDAQGAALDAADPVAAIAALRAVSAILRDVTERPTPKVEPKPADPRAAAADALAVLSIARAGVLAQFDQAEHAAIVDAATLREGDPEVVAALFNRAAQVVAKVTRQPAKGGSGAGRGSGSSSGVGLNGGQGDPAQHVAEVMAAQPIGSRLTMGDLRGHASSQYAAGTASPGALWNAVRDGRVPNVAAAQVVKPGSTRQVNAAERVA